MILPLPLELPASPYVRRHGPHGISYDKSKAWLRDEFQFRCVYCLHRERWDRDGWRAFQIDHVVPQSVDRSKIHLYENCVYCCASCNRTKQDRSLPDPCVTPFCVHYRFEADGTVTPLSKDGAIYVEILGLDAPHLQEFRRRVHRTCGRLEELLDVIGDDPDLLDDEGTLEEIDDLLGYPDDIPDLRKKRLKSNSKPDGRNQCYFAQLERGEIPRLY